MSLRYEKLWRKESTYYPFQNRRRVIASWITRECKQLWRSGFHHNVAKTGARNDMRKLKISSRSVGRFEGGIEKLPCRRGKVRWIFVCKAWIRCRKSFSTILCNSQVYPTLRSNARGSPQKRLKSGFSGRKLSFSAWYMPKKVMVYRFSNSLIMVVMFVCYTRTAIALHCRSRLISDYFDFWPLLWVRQWSELKCLV